MTLDPQEARELLHAEREQALERRRAAEEHFVHDQAPDSPETNTIHPGDAAAAVRDRELAQTSLEQADADLQDADAALQRLEEGTYGRCEVDGEPIDEERLRAKPAARYCTAHQQDVEAQA